MSTIPFPDWIRQGLKANSYTIYADPTTYYAEPSRESGLQPYSGKSPSTVIQNAINALAATGGKILVKKGIYTLTATITVTISNLTIEFEQNAELRIPATGIPTTAVSAGSNQMICLIIRLGSNIQIIGGTFNYLGVANNSRGLYVGDGATNVSVYGANAINHGNFGFSVGSYTNGTTGRFSDVLFFDCTSSNCGNVAGVDGGGFKVDDAGNVLSSGPIFIIACSVKSTKVYGVDIGSTNTEAIHIIDNDLVSTSNFPNVFIEAFSNNFSIIEGNRISGGLYGINVLTPAGRILVNGNVVENAVRDGISVLNNGSVNGYGYVVSN